MHEREVESRLTELKSQYQRIVDHVNREIGVSQDVPLCQRVTALEATKPNGYDAELVKGKNSSKNDDETKG